MSATKHEHMDTAANDELGRSSELAYDEALFGLPPSIARELDDAGDRIALLREQLSLVTSGLALREVVTREPLPPDLRAIVQTQAFGYFERRVSAPPPTATTTGANVLEFAPASTRTLPRKRTWLTALAVAACFAMIGLSLRWQVGRDPAAASKPSTTTTAAVALAGSLSASKLGAQAELVQTGQERRLAFSLTGASNLRLPPTAALWIRAQRASGMSWQRIVAIQPNADGTAHIVFDSDEQQRVVGFAVTVPTLEDSSLPDLEHAQLEASVSQ